MTAALYHQQLLSPEGYDHAEYLLEDRGLSPQAIEHFQLGAVLDPADDDLRMSDRVSIPSISPTVVAQLQYRAAPWQETDRKYMASTGSQTIPFNTRSLLEHGRWIAITEGELDCVAAWMAGVPAVGIPGVNNWRPAFAQLFEGYERTYILADNDPSKVDENGKERGLQGLQFAEGLAELLPNPTIVLMPEEGDDVNEVVRREGPQALRDLMRLDKQ